MHSTAAQLKSLMVEMSSGEMLLRMRFLTIGDVDYIAWMR